ncbi:MAG: hypothetical protein ACFFCS_09600 [Candidatus Hodarchaeota archaeon]
MEDDMRCPNCSSSLVKVGKALLKCESCNVTMPKISLVLKHDENVYKNALCHDCGRKEGEIHEYGCDMEICPFCGLQIITCGCIYKKLGYDYDPEKENDGLPLDVYKNGVSDEEREKFMQILEKKGRIPALSFPVICRGCGKKYPTTIIWEDWKKVPESMKWRSKSLCIPCFMKLRDEGEGSVQLLELCEYCGSKQTAYKIKSEKIEASVQGKLLCAKCHDYIKDLLHMDDNMEKA